MVATAHYTYKVVYTLIQKSEDFTSKIACFASLRL